MVKKLNRRVTVIVPGVTQNDQGGNVATELDSWTKWAQVENRSGSNSFPNQQQVWQYDYKVTMRYEPSRPTKSNYELEYENYRLKIESIEIDSEGYKGYEICRCSKIDENITDGDSS
jgi:SPP1 family predicted phage head-tail adaptor